VQVNGLCQTLIGIGTNFRPIKQGPQSFAKDKTIRKTRGPIFQEEEKKEDDGVASKHFKEVTAKVFKKRKRKVLSNFNPCQLYSGEQDWLYDVFLAMLAATLPIRGSGRVFKLLASLSPKLEQEILVGFQSILECVQ